MDTRNGKRIRDCLEENFQSNEKSQETNKGIVKLTMLIITL